MRREFRIMNAEFGKKKSVVEENVEFRITNAER